MATTKYTRRVLMFVNAAQQKTANDLMAQIDTTGGGNTFTFGLSPLGTGVPTHYWAWGSFTEAEYQSILTKFAALITLGQVQVTERSLDKGHPDDVLTTKVLKQM